MNPLESPQIPSRAGGSIFESPSLIMDRMELKTNASHTLKPYAKLSETSSGYHIWLWLFLPPCFSLMLPPTASPSPPHTHSPLYYPASSLHFSLFAPWFTPLVWSCPHPAAYPACLFLSHHPYSSFSFTLCSHSF